MLPLSLIYAAEGARDWVFFPPVTALQVIDAKGRLDRGQNRQGRGQVRLVKPLTQLISHFSGRVSDKANPVTRRHRAEIKRQRRFQILAVCSNLRKTTVV